MADDPQPSILEELDRAVEVIANELAQIRRGVETDLKPLVDANTRWIGDLIRITRRLAVEVDQLRQSDN